MSHVFGPTAKHAIVLTYSRNFVVKPASKLRHVSLGVMPLVRCTSYLVYAHNVLRSIVPPAAGGSVYLHSSTNASVLARLGSGMLVSVRSTMHVGISTVTIVLTVNSGTRRTGAITGLCGTMSGNAHCNVPIVKIATINGRVTHSTHCFNLTSHVTTRGNTGVMGACCYSNFRGITTTYPIPMIVTNNGGLPRESTLRLYCVTVGSNTSKMSVKHGMFRSRTPTTVVRTICTMMRRGCDMSRTFRLFGRLGTG